MDTSNENSAINIDNDNVNTIVNDKNDTDNIINDSSKDEPSNKLRYQSFEGANLFICGGRIMLGKVTSHLFISLSLIILTWIVYTGAVIPFLHSPILLMISWTIGCINISLLIAVATTEPGIVPRSKIDISSIPAAVVNNLKKRYTYCQICQIYRPSRSKHCRHCDNCVDTFDHHCPWTGNCIGARNYFIFFCFVTSILVGALFVLLSSLLLLIGWIYNVPCNYPTLRGIVTISMMAWSSVCLSLVGTLWLFHLFLINRGSTTCEYLRKINPPTVEPTTYIGKLCSNVCCCAAPCCFQSELSCCLLNPTKLLPQYLPTTELDDEISLERLNKYIQSVY